MKMFGAAVAFVALTAFAHAGEMEGKIKMVDVEKKMVELDDGTSMMAADSVMLDNLMAGDDVTITTDSQNMVTDIKKK